MALLALAACHSPRREAKRMVRRAEQLFDTLPDSTARLIDSVLRMPVYFEEGKRMYIAMLQGEALFGDRGQEIPPLMDDEFFDDKPFFSTSPELERAANYYARKKQYDKAAHAALYSGFVQQYYKEKAHAMQSFKDAEHYGNLAGDSLSVARAQYWMGKMLYDDFTYNDVLSLLKSSVKGIGNRFAERAFVLNSMACCYLVQGDHENAEKCLQQSLEFAEKCHDDKVKRKVLNNYAVLYRILGKHEQSIECLRQTIGDNHDDAKEFVTYLNLGRTFMAAGNVDSASLYLERVESLLPATSIKAATQVSAYVALSSFAEARNDYPLALAYHKSIEDLLSKIMFQRQEQSIYRIQQQYDYENIQNALSRKIIIRHRIILIISILLFLAAIIILVLQLRHKRMREAEVELKMQIDSLKNNLRDSVKSTYLEQELSSRLRLLISAYRTKEQAHDPKKEWTPVVFRLMNGKDTLFDAILVEMEKVYPGIFAVLQQRFPELNETETKVCLLSCSDLSNAEMAAVLGISQNTVNKNRSKLRNKLNLTSDKMKEQLHKVLSN